MVAGTVFAFPEGAPWGAADPDSIDNCSNCHFDNAAIHDSPALSIVGLPERPKPGESYELTIHFDDPDAVIAGFQMLASAANPPGTFATAAANLEYIGAAVRSTEPRPNDNGVRWQLTWTAPETPGTDVTFFIAAMGANDDGSPFGDRVHFRTFHVSM